MNKTRAATLALLSAILLGASPAFAAPTGLFGNTLQITQPNGQTKVYYVNADGSYTGVFPGGAAVSGTWAEVDGEMCFTQQQPTVSTAQCGPLITQAVGATWTAPRSDGTVTQLTIVAGR